MRHTTLICLALALPAGAPAGAAPPALSTDRFANVFVEAQPVRLSVAPGDAAAVVLRDVEGKEVARKDAPTAAGPSVVDFGAVPPGYYEAVAGESLLPLAVLVDPAKRVPGESRLATDSAMSWLVKGEQFENVAEVLRLAGFTWVRERLSWGEVEKERGKVEWGRYEASAAALAKRGIRVYQVFHGVPGWARADKDTKAAPDDLRDIYRFAQALAKQFRGRVQAWEVWNEPDISFFSHPASECAAFQKAAFLGFRSVDPEQQVLGPSMAHGAGPFSDHLLANGAGHYMDIWNYHIYADPATYRDRHAAFRKQLAAHGADLPSWVTEAGDRVDGPEGVLTPKSRVHQAAFVSRAFPQALEAGIDRHFWFVFPFYREGQVGWGVFEPDERAPFPGLAALSAATYALGKGNPLGRLALPDKEARALAFDRGDGTAAVAVWREADAPADVALPLQWQQVREARNHVGTPLPAGEGPVRFTVARAGITLILPAEALRGKVTPRTETEAPRRAPAPGLPQIVTRLRALDARADKDVEGYVVPASGVAALQMEAYNFGPTPFAGELRLEAPAGWVLDRERVPVTIAAGERAVVPVRATAPEGLKRADLRLVAAAGAKQSAPALLNLGVDPIGAKPRETRALPLEKLEAWAKNIAGHGSMEIAAGPEGGVRFAFTFRAAGDNWAYPQTRFEPPLDLSAYDGLRFDYRTSVADSGPVRVMVVEPEGSTYMTGNGLPGSTAWRTATVLFDTLIHLGLSAADANGRLDTDRIATLRFGANSKPQSLVLEVRNVAAVKF